MFHTAYVCFLAETQINRSTNSFSVDGGKKIPFSGLRTYYQIPPGEHTITVTSGAGNQWDVSRQMRAGEVTIIKMAVWEGDVSDVLYKLEPAHWGIGLLAKKLPGSDMHK